ncbi:MAG: RHS repeat-associated core domain-containing protein [Bacteroidales bacterium]|nr:RHS repeat-associated core domain-containing protein [Bacteroidales bacterium]
MNRPVIITQPNNHAVVNKYNKGGLLEQVKEGTTSYISNIDYNARGQRTKVVYGNSSETTYTYDDENFRLTRLLTTKSTGSVILQDLNYTYDSVGNVIEVEDDAQQTIYFNNTVIDPISTFEYDALYRLIEATGRELTSLQLPSNTDFVNNIPVPNTGTNAMQTYTQQYAYDEIGNITQMKSVGDWTRDYIYDTSTNQLLRHTGSTNVYTYDAHGNILTMPHLTSMVWDNKDQLVSAGNGTVTSYYNYDAQGDRTRKVVVKPGGIVEERYYIGGYEVYRKFISNSLDKERETVHIMDDRDRFAMIDTLTVENGTTLTTPVETLRYQYNNHLGTACLELDGSAAIISYEEYHPFGTTSYRSGRSEAEVSLKRYKYVGKERDEETGLYYYGARYYASWLCRFVSCDPLQHEYPHYTPYQYAGNKPITYIDLDGLEEAKPWGKWKELKEQAKKISNEVKTVSGTGTDIDPFVLQEIEIIGYKVTGQTEYKWSEGEVKDEKLEVDPFTYTNQLSPRGLSIDTRDYLSYSVIVVTGSLEVGAAGFDKQWMYIKLDDNPYYIWGGASFWLSTSQHSSFDFAVGGSGSVTYGEGTLKLPSQNFTDISKMFENSYANGIDFEAGIFNIAGINLGTLTFHFQDGSQSEVVFWGINGGYNLGSPVSVSPEYGEGHESKIKSVNYNKTSEDSLKVRKLLETKREVW